MVPKYSQHYRADWEKMADFKEWLQPVENDTSKAYCKYCKCEMIAKLSVLRLHISSAKHRKAIEPMKSQKKINFPKVKKDLNTQKAESSLALFVCEHCAIMAVDHLSELCKYRFLDSKYSDIKLHRTKCTNIIKNVLAPHFIQEIVTDLGDQEYSLLIDESTDILVLKMLGVSIRYFSRSLKKIISTFLGLVEIEDGTAVSIVNGIKGLLAEIKINLKKLIGIGTDNASVMTGTNSGVHALLKNATGNDNLVLVRCVCHSLQLAMSHASAETLPRNVEFLIRETYNWFSHSSNRRLFYKNMFQTINGGSVPLTIPQMCNTRWISIEPAVCRILDQWIELKTLFEIARRDEHCYTAEILYNMYNDPQNHLYLLYIRPILQEVQVVNKLFESNDVDPTRLYNDLIGLVESIGRRILNPTARVDILTEDIESYLDPKPYMGYAFETKLLEYNLQPNAANYLRQRCNNFTLKLVTELRSRLPVNFKILQKISMFSVQETLKVVKPSIVEIAQEFRVNAPMIEKLVSQWRNIVHIKWESLTSTVKFWNEVMQYKDAADNNPFAELCEFAMSLISLPHSNADVERVFSQMSLVKTKLRNRLAVRTLNAILYVRFGLKRAGKCCYSYTVPDNVLRSIGTKEYYDSGSQPSTSADVDEDEDLNILFP
ncbi:unnamed protein product [Parnassius apollo]|uniref:(apollo) hypothetical protein n=1 Tax=Parnassius apollo TaxID=110799 RepID=A0A8S3Y228_PARAO|nr:unnamed protein product [Parnassius apollo]